MMPKAEYSRGINNSSLILIQEKDDGAEQSSEKMFQYNKIPYFLNMRVQKKDGRKQYCYDITGRKSLDQLLDYKLLDDVLLLKLLNSFDQACMQVENYLLTENDILLKPEMVFLDNETESVLYCYLPGNQEDICGQFREFMEYLLQHLDYKNEQAVQTAYGVYQRVAEEQAGLHTILKGMVQSYSSENAEYRSPLTGSAPVFSQPVSTLPNALYESGEPAQEVSDKPASFIQEQSEKDIQKQPEKAVQKQQKETGKKKERQPDLTEGAPKLKQKEAAKNQAAEKLKNLLRKKLYTNNYRNVEEEPVFHEDIEEVPYINPTVCIMADTEGIQNQFVYQGMDRTRDFQCTEGKMILGSSREECDICIPLPMVSRVHARIEINAQGTFLEDMNSTNGTQINGELLKYRKKYLLNKGDMISLAGENYSFR